MQTTEPTRTQRLNALRVHLRAAEAHTMAARLTENAERCSPTHALSIGAAAARTAAAEASQRALDLWHDAAPSDWAERVEQGGQLVYLHKTAAAAHGAAATRAGRGQRWSRVRA